MPRTLTVEERVKELEMMTQPQGWPAWPYLPVKKHKPEGGLPECGVLFEGKVLDEVKPIVYDHNLFSADLFNDHKIKAEYISFQALLDDGWMVD